MTTSPTTLKRKSTAIDSLFKTKQQLFDSSDTHVEFANLTAENLDQKLRRHGYCVIKNVLPPNKVAEYLARFRDAYKNIADAAVPDKPLGYDIFDPATFAANHDDLIPYGGIGQVHASGIGSLRLMDDLRSEDNLRCVWALHHCTTRASLTPSRDGASVFRPHHPAHGDWWHIDANPSNPQSVLRENMLQGVFVLSAPYDDQGFVVSPGSHKKLSKWIGDDDDNNEDSADKNNGNSYSTNDKDWHPLTAKQLAAQGLRARVVVPGAPGELIVFRSWVAHCNTGGVRAKHTAVGRVALYLSYTPMEMISESQRAILETAVAERRTTNHNLIRVSLKPERVARSARRWTCAPQDLADYSKTGVPRTIIPWSKN
jgi:ectoine hydroxylase-related dioxygenase (phytanoyl-CoA dioxygenase family)